MIAPFLVLRVFKQFQALLAWGSYARWIPDLLLYFMEGLR